MRRAMAGVLAANLLVVAAQVAVLTGMEDGADASSPGEPIESVQPTDLPTSSPSPTGSPAASTLDAVEGLGGWLDRYDYGLLDPVAAVADMRGYGVRTLYLNTGISRHADDVVPGVGPWLVAAKDAGLSAIAWYVPTLEDVDLDLRRLRAAADFRSGGRGFDGLVLDLVVHDLDSATYNERLRRLVSRLDVGVPVVVATLSDRMLRAGGPVWDGLPWDRLSAIAEAWIVYEPWGAPGCGVACAGRRADDAIVAIRARIGEDLPVHLLGGPADDVSSTEVRRFARRARAGGAAGVSIYDAVTMRPDLWRALGSF